MSTRHTHGTIAGARHRTLAVAVGVALLSCLTACTERAAPPTASSRQAAAAHDAATLRRGLGGEPETLDPHRAIDSFALAVLRDLFEGLVTEDRDGRIVPGAAARWDVSRDALSYTFQLRPNLAWSNGDVLTALDFAAGLRRTLDPATASPSAEFFSGIRSPDGVQATDDRTLAIRLSRPTPHFLKVLATPAAAPLHRPSFSRYGPDFARAGRLVSNGAYTLEAWKPGTKLTLARNRHYRGAGDVGFARVQYVALPESSVELALYRAGQLDVTSTVPAQDAGWVRDGLVEELQIAPHLAVYYYAFDLSEPPFRDNAALREALVLALNRDVLTRSVAGFAPEPAYGFVPPGTDRYTPQSWAWRTWSDDARLRRARAQFAAAGYGREKPLRLTLLYNSNDAIRRMTLAVAAMWKEALGVETELINEEFRVFLSSRRDRGRWDIVRMGWTADYDDAGNFLAVMRSTSPNNDAGYANPEFDKLLTRAEAESDSGRRREFLEQAERTLLADHALIPVYFYVTRRLVKPHLDGPLPTPLNHSYSKFWRVKHVPAYTARAP